MASSSADWVLGPVRLISSTSSTSANSGPRRNTNSFFEESKMCVPTMSLGMRSAVPCTRLNSPPSTRASVFASSVLPSPGGPCTSTWPRAISAMHSARITSSAPTMTRASSR